MDDETPPGRRPPKPPAEDPRGAAARTPRAPRDAKARNPRWPLWLHLIAVGQWIVLNLPGAPWPRFDPSCAILAALLAVELAVVGLARLVRQGQARQARRWQRELELRRRLLAERRLARLLQLAAEIAAETAEDPEPSGEVPAPRRAKALDGRAPGRVHPKRRGRG